MTSLVLDTNVLIPLLRDVSGFVAGIRNYDEVIIPATVLGEYRAGLFATKVGELNRKVLEDYLVSPSVRAVPVTDRTAELYAKVYQALRKQGTPIPQNDMWIAASALEHGADIATYDEHFNLVPMLTVVLVPKSTP